VKKPRAAHFEILLEVDIPRSRKSKHHDIVGAILEDLDKLKPGSAFKVPLDELGGSKANVRSALNRATKKSHRKVATATDEKFLYVWNMIPVLPTASANPRGKGTI
jgi:hypothetical protein